MRLLKLKRLNQSGDTIVEVLIVLAVLSMSFGISYATANGSLTKSRSSEEHTEAQGILSSQAEQLRAAVANNATLPNSSTFCFGNSTGNIVTQSPWNQSALDTNPGDYPASCNFNSFYFASIVYVPSSGTTQAYYDLQVRWQGLGSLGVQQVEYTYAITPTSISLTNNGYLNCTQTACTPPPPTPPAAPTINSFSANGQPTGYIHIAKGGANLNLTWNVTPDINTTTTCTVNDQYSQIVSNGSTSGHTNADASVITYINKDTLTSFPSSPLTFTLNCISTSNINQQQSSSAQTLIVYVEQPFYRMYNPLGDHFYTASPSEESSLNSGGGWNYQNITGYIDQAQGPNEIPLYRMWSTTYNGHFYTANNFVHTQIAPLFGYVDEGIAGYVLSNTDPQCGGAATYLFRLTRYTSGTFTFDQFYTINPGEWITKTDKIANVSGYVQNSVDGITACIYR